MERYQFKVEDPNFLLELINNGEIEILATADDDGVAPFPNPNSSSDSLWNIDIDSIFSSAQNTSRKEIKRKNRAVTSHRLLTSREVIQENQAVANK